MQPHNTNNFTPDNEAKIILLFTQLATVTARLTTVNACYQQNNKTYLQLGPQQILTNLLIPALDCAVFYVPSNTV